MEATTMRFLLLALFFTFLSGGIAAKEPARRGLVIPIDLGKKVAAKKPRVERGPIIGIDLGTTYSCVGVYKNDRVEIIADDQGSRITPSWVAFTDSERLVGEAGRHQAPLDPERTVFDVKRLIGRKFDDPEVVKDSRFLPYKIVNKDGKAYIQVQVKGETKVFSPEEISAMVLVKMKETAEKYLGKNVNDAVITVPGYFNDAQRHATQDAARIAGLKVARILNEPTAAAVAYGLDENEAEQNFLIFDLGGGTFDVTVLTIDHGVFEVLSIGGDTHLGGKDFDHRVMSHFIKLIKKKHNKDISKDHHALGKLRKECERAKRALSSQQQVRIEIESLFDGVDFSEPLTRAEFEDLNADLFRKTIGLVKQTMEEAGLEKSDIHEIVLVGGSTRIPKVQQFLKDYFGGKEPKKGVNPDEAVAYGAAFQGGILSGEYKIDYEDGVPLEVNSLSLGIETAGGIIATIVPRNSIKPNRKSQIFTTHLDNQTVVSIRVYEGERSLAKDCHELGTLELSGIPPAPRGVPRIEVTFQVDFNGVMHVRAEDKATNRSQSITITGMYSRLSWEEIMQQIKESEEFMEEDRRMRERINARNRLESYVYGMKSTVRDMLEPDEKERVDSARREAMKWLDDNHDAEMEEYDEKLEEIRRFAIL